MDNIDDLIAILVHDDMFERLDDGLPPRTPEEAAAREPWERLIARIRELEDIAPPEGWEQRAQVRWYVARSLQRSAPWRAVVTPSPRAGTRRSTRGRDPRARQG